ARSALHQFNAHAVRRGDVAQKAGVHPSFQLDREAHPLAAQLGAERFEIALVQEAEMVGAPGIMAGKVGIFANGPGGSGSPPGRWPRTRIVIPPRSTKI